MSFDLEPPEEKRRFSLTVLILWLIVWLIGWLAVGLLILAGVMVWGAIL